MQSVLLNAETLAANKTVPQELFAVKKISNGIIRAKTSVVRVAFSTDDATPRTCSLKVVGVDGTIVTLGTATIDNTSLGSGIITSRIALTADQKLNGAKSLIATIDDLTAGKKYSTVALITYE